METETIVIVSVLSSAWALLLLAVVVLTCQQSRLRRQVAELMAHPRLKAQKATLESDNNHASPDEELSRRGYSMYVAEDVESGRGTTERQTGGRLMEELTQELERQQQRRSPPPPFLLSAIEDNRRSRSLGNPAANSKVNPMANPAANSTFNPMANSTVNPGANATVNPMANPSNNQGKAGLTNPNFTY